MIYIEMECENEYKYNNITLDLFNFKSFFVGLGIGLVGGLAIGLMVGLMVGLLARWQVDRR